MPPPPSKRQKRDPSPESKPETEQTEVFGAFSPSCKVEVRYGKLWYNARFVEFSEEHEKWDCYVEYHDMPDRKYGTIAPFVRWPIGSIYDDPNNPLPEHVRNYFQGSVRENGNELNKMDSGWDEYEEETD